MGLLRKSNDASAPPAAAVTLIAHGTYLEGSLSGGGRVHVDGAVRGEIVHAEHASVGTTGRFAGSIKAEHVLISGSFEGTIECRQLEITDTGRVVGELSCDELTIDGGGRFSGTRRTREQPASAVDSTPATEHAPKSHDRPRMIAKDELEACLAGAEASLG